MKIKIAILDQDQNYQNRLLVALRERFSDLIDVVPCNSENEIENIVEVQAPDLFVINGMLDVDLSLIPRECAVARFTEFKSETEVDGRPGICKYQKVSEICRSFLKMTKDYKNQIKEELENERKAEEERLERERKAEEERAERERQAEEERLERERQAEEERIRQEEERKVEEERLKKEEEERIEAEKKAAEEEIRTRRSNPKVYTFLSSLPMDGSTTMSTTFAANLASKDNKVLYISLKQSKNTDELLYSDEKLIELKDIISSANDGSLTCGNLKNAISECSMSFDYISSNDSPFELMRLSLQGFKKIFDTVKEMAAYDVIVICIDTYLTEVNFESLSIANKVIVVGTGFKESNQKIEKMFNLTYKYDEDNQTEISKKVCILYNKYVNKKCSPLNLPGVTNYGPINVINNNDTKVLIGKIVNMTVFDQITEE